MKKAQEEIRIFTKERNWGQFHTPANLSKSIVLEAAELLECFQWDDAHYDLEHVKEELADVMTYCLQLCEVLQVDPETIVLDKLEKTKLKYPVEKARNKATKYTKLKDEQ